MSLSVIGGVQLVGAAGGEVQQLRSKWIERSRWLLYPGVVVENRKDELKEKLKRWNVDGI